MSLCNYLCYILEIYESINYYGLCMKALNVIECYWEECIYISQTTTSLFICFFQTTNCVLISQSLRAGSNSVGGGHCK
jgi:hypothetical protein